MMSETSHRIIALDPRRPIDVLVVDPETGKASWFRATPAQARAYGQNDPFWRDATDDAPPAPPPPSWWRSLFKNR